MVNYQPTVHGLYPFPASRQADPFTHNKVNVLKTFRIANSETDLPDPSDYSTYDIIRLDDGTLYMRNGSGLWEEWPDIPVVEEGLMLDPSETDPTSPETGNIYFNTVLEYYRAWDGSSWIPASLKYSMVDGANNGISDIVLPKFIPGWTELYVLGKQGFWFPKFSGSTQYMFEEVQDGFGDYTIIRPRYTMGAGPYFIKYIADL